MRRALVLANNEELVETIGRGGGNTRLVFTSSLTEEQLESSAPAKWTPGLGTERAVRLLYSGRIVREKGLFEAISAVRMLADEGVNAVFELVGWEDPTDPTIGRLFDHARALGVEDAVSHLGYLPAGQSLLEAYGSADVFVIPTYWEGFPRAIIDAMGMGRPVVACAVGGIRRRLTDHHDALLIQPRSPQAIADAVRELIADRTLWERLTASGLEYARQHTLERSARLVADHIREWTVRVRSATGY
jgi:glycosyltransferase involved in cell wall biosynthesis